MGWLDEILGVHEHVHEARSGGIAEAAHQAAGEAQRRGEIEQRVETYKAEDPEYQQWKAEFNRAYDLRHEGSLEEAQEIFSRLHPLMSEREQYWRFMAEQEVGPEPLDRPIW